MPHPRKTAHPIWTRSLMTPSNGPAEHEQRYRAALLAFQDASGRPPDRHWRVLLHLLTALPGLWQATRGRLDFVHGTAHLDPAEFTSLSTSERALLAIGSNLFSGRGAVDLALAIRCVDSVRWRILIRAIDLYRALPEDPRPPVSSRVSPAARPGYQTRGMTWPAP